MSVAMATFDGGRFVEEQLRSILEQVPSPFEVIVSDDGSTDDTLDIVRRVSAQHPGTTTRILQGERRGVSGNFERAIREATGDLIALADQDDRWHPGRLAALIAEFDSDGGLLLLHHNADLIDGNGAPLGRTLHADLRVRDQERAFIASDRAFDAYIRRNLATGATVVFRRSELAQALPFPPGWVHDEWLAITAAAIGRVRMLDRSLIDYRQHDSNQIGVSKPTLRYRLRRMLAVRGSQYVDLASRSSELTTRLRALPVEESWREVAAEKAAFEAARARYPRRRTARIGPIARQRRGYSRLSSQGALDIVRDLVQPA